MTAPVILAATAKHTATFIFLHGLGDTGHGWASAIAALRPSYMKVICPTAPTRPVSLNGGYRMNSWFDIHSLEVDSTEDEEGIKKASTDIHRMIDDEIKAGIPAHRIMVGGFSQGGSLALYSALTTNEKLAGVVALSCWIPLRKTLPTDRIARDDLPIFVCHGQCDPIVLFKIGQLSASMLKSFMKNVEFRSYRGLAHTSSDEELHDVKEFIDLNLPPQ